MCSWLLASSQGDVTLVSMPGRGWLLLEAHGLIIEGFCCRHHFAPASPWTQVVASLLVASDGFNRQLQCSRDWNASNVVPLCLPCVVPEGIDTCMYDFSGCWAHLLLSQLLVLMVVLVQCCSMPVLLQTLYLLCFNQGLFFLRFLWS